MGILKHLKAKFIYSDVSSTVKEEVIKEVASLLKDSPEINNYSQFLEDVFEREASMTTGIGQQIAIPHARTEAVNNIVIALGRSQNGVEFEAMDNQPVKLIFLIGTPKKDMDAYLKVLAYLTRLLKKEEFRNQLLNAKDAEEIVAVFESVEK